MMRPTPVPCRLLQKQCRRKGVPIFLRAVGWRREELDRQDAARNHLRRDASSPDSTPGGASVSSRPAFFDSDRFPCNFPWPFGPIHWGLVAILDAVVLVGLAYRAE
jgi:hypothetical protein